MKFAGLYFCFFMSGFSTLEAGSQEATNGANRLPTFLRRLDLARALGAVLDVRWRSRPEWGDMAVAIFKGEAMDTRKGWWRPARQRLGVEWLCSRFDTNLDGKVDRAELPEAATYFQRLDANSDGVISALDFKKPRGASSDGEARALFRALDSDSNGRVSRDELKKFFDGADSGKLGFLTPEDLTAALSDPDSGKAKASDGDEGPSPWQMLVMLLDGQLGSLREGPALGELAPDFTLRARDGKSSFTLSSSRAKKPVVLIFGSFT